MNTFNLIYGISYMGAVTLTFATGIGYYILRTGYVEMNDGRDDIGYKAGDTYSSPAEQS